jgi:hypothetical protein
VSELGDLIIGTQRWMAGDVIPERLRLIASDDLNALRDELIRLRAIAAKVNDQGRFDVMGDINENGSWITLACDRCQWSADIEDPVGLRDVNERAQDHAEVCE